VVATVLEGVTPADARALPWHPTTSIATYIAWAGWHEQGARAADAATRAIRARAAADAAAATAARAPSPSAADAAEAAHRAADAAGAAASASSAAIAGGNPVAVVPTPWLAAYPFPVTYWASFFYPPGHVGHRQRAHVKRSQRHRRGQQPPDRPAAEHRRARHGRRETGAQQPREHRSRRNPPAGHEGGQFGAHVDQAAAHRGRLRRGRWGEKGRPVRHREGIGGSPVAVVPTPWLAAYPFPVPYWASFFSPPTPPQAATTCGGLIDVRAELAALVAGGRVPPRAVLAGLLRARRASAVTGAAVLSGWTIGRLLPAAVTLAAFDGRTLAVADVAGVGGMADALDAAGVAWALRELLGGHVAVGAAEVAALEWLLVDRFTVLTGAPPPRSRESGRGRRWEPEGRPLPGPAGNCLPVGARE